MATPSDAYSVARILADLEDFHGYLCPCGSRRFRRNFKTKIARPYYYVFAGELRCFVCDAIPRPDVSELRWTGIHFDDDNSVYFKNAVTLRIARLP